MQLDCALDAWRRHGLWVLCRGDASYPSRLRTHLQTQAPALLFGAGDLSLLDAGGLAIAGSRNIDAAAEAFTDRTARLCAASGIAIVSGGARGVDSIAMSAALDAGGTAVGVLADGLLRKSLARQARTAIACGRLLLLSPWHPQAAFAAWAAMGRNKIVYVLADCALAVSAEWRKGGTWAGAEEELRREHARPVFVRTGPEAPEGNAKLLEIGAVPWPGDPVKEPCQGAGTPSLRARLREAFARAQAEKAGRRKAVQASLAGIIEAGRARTCA